MSLDAESFRVRVNGVTGRVEIKTSASYGPPVEHVLTFPIENWPKIKQFIDEDIAKVEEHRKQNVSNGNLGAAEQARLVARFGAERVTRD